MINYFLNKKNKLIKFLIIGLFLAIVNIVLMYFFVDVLSFNTVLLKNLANIFIG